MLCSGIYSETDAILVGGHAFKPRILSGLPTIEDLSLPGLLIICNHGFLALICTGKFQC
jgi:hypothetical protein